MIILIYKEIFCLYKMAVHEFGDYNKNAKSADLP